MQLKRGQQYPVLNINVPQGDRGAPPWLRITEILTYNQTYIVWGEKLAHQQHIWQHGYESIPAWGSGGVVFPGETLHSELREGKITITGTLQPLLLQLRGQPVLLGDPQYSGLWNAQGKPMLEVGIPLIGWSYQLGGLWWSEQRPMHDEFVRQARIVVDLYYEWKNKKIFPRWFLDGRNGRPKFETDGVRP